MALLRPVTKQALTDPKYDIHSRDIEVKDGQQYIIASFFFNKYDDILYFNYWSDADRARGNGQLTYSISREDVAWYEENEEIF